MRENDFYTFVPSDLDLWPQMCSLVTFVKGHVLTKWEISVASLFRENRRHGTDGRTDGRTDGQTDGMLGLPVDFAYTDINKKLPYVLYCDKKKEYTGWSKKAISLF